MHGRTALSPMTRFGPFTLDAESGELRKGTTRLKVPDQSIEVLKALVERPGQLVTREELRQRLWSSDTFVDFDAGLNAAVKRLRDALGDSADRPILIETLPRRGYRFIGRLEMTEPAQDALTNDVPPGSEVESDATNVRPIPRVAGIRPVTVLLMLAVVAAAAVGALVGLRAGHGVTPAALNSVPVTTYAGREVDPSISPDGQQVAFAWDTDDGDNFDIYVKQIGRDERLRLTTDPAIERRPVWSPDGQRIAFLRQEADARATIVVVPALGGREQPVVDAQTPFAPLTSDLSWTPDGKGLLYLDRVGLSLAVFVCWIDTRERLQLTTPEPDYSDASPVIAPDGSRLAFVRRFFGFNGGRVLVQPIENMRPIGKPRALTSDDAAAGVDWTADGRSLVYGSALGLLRVRADGGPSEQVYAGVGFLTPSVARHGHRLVFQHLTTDNNIWRIEGPSSGNWPSATRPIKIVSSTHTDTSPHISYDGRRIAYRSERSGSPEIWVSNIDGSEPVQLTHADGRFVGSPRWSPNGEWIALDSIGSGTFSIYVVSAHGGAMQQVTTTRNSVRPSWSHDGRWIYFSSTQSGSEQIWKIRSNGQGAAIQLTNDGGYEPFESFDGLYVYYAKMRATPGIWHVPIDGGEEVKVLGRGIESSWGLTTQGIVVMDKLARPQASIEFYRFDSTLSNRILLPAELRFDQGDTTFSVATNGAWIVYAQLDSWGSDIEMIDGFR
jgi:Tol biopolymer transport system component/DNA-binding winged helix-turn-helix (wHTH) protein